MRLRSSAHIGLLALFVLPLLVIWRCGVPESSGDVRSLFPQRSPTVRALNQIERTFGETLVDTFLVPLKGVSEEERSQRFYELEESFSQLESLQAVHSPGQVFGKLPPPIPLANGEWARFILEIPADLPDIERHELNTQLNNLLRPGELRSGPFVASEAATSSVQREGERWGPVCFVVIFGFLLAITRRLSTALKLISVPVAVVLITQALLSALAVPVLPLSQLVTPLSLALVTTYSVYVGLLLVAGEDEPEIRKSLIQSISLAAVTTAAGFVSLLFMDSGAVRQFAGLMAFVTVLGAILSLLVTPALVRSENTKPLHQLLLRFEQDAGRKWGSGVVGGVLLLIAGAGIVKLDVDTDPLLFLPVWSPVRMQIEQSEQAFPGSHVLSVMLTGAVNDTTLPEISAIADELSKLDGVHEVVSAEQFVRYREKLLELEPSAFIPFGRFGPRSITAEDEKHTRILLFNDLDGRALVNLAREAKRRIEARVVFSGEVASRELVLSEQSTGLSRGLLESVTSALLLVVVLLLSIFRSVPLALVGSLPSILPILGIFGAMGYLYGDVNLGAALVAATALGMISDNTFHLLITARGLGERNLERARQLAFGPFVLTAATLVLGFAPMIFSAVLPVRQFGLLLALSLGFGVWLNLTLLPWLVQKIRG